MSLYRRSRYYFWNTVINVERAVLDCCWVDGAKSRSAIDDIALYIAAKILREIKVTVNEGMSLELEAKEYIARRLLWRGIDLDGDDNYQQFLAEELVKKINDQMVATMSTPLIVTYSQIKKAANAAITGNCISILKSRYEEEKTECDDSSRFTDRRSIKSSEIDVRLTRLQLFGSVAYTLENSKEHSRTLAYDANSGKSYWETYYQAKNVTKADVNNNRVVVVPLEAENKVQQTYIRKAENVTQDNVDNGGAVIVYTKELDPVVMLKSCPEITQAEVDERLGTDAWRDLVQLTANDTSLVI